MDKKIDFRTKAKNIRSGLDIRNISLKLCQKLRECEIYKSAKNIMIFYPLENEIDTLSLLADNKNFFLPRMKDNDLEVCPYRIYDELKISKFNVKEPLTDGINPELLDLIVVPALMVDKKNYRLGYGKGFYDRFLEKTMADTVTLIPKELVVDNLPIEEQDKKINLIITE